jgi:hypothetical protein
MSGDPRPIDHKDEPGEYRDLVREAVIKVVGMQGQPVTSRDELVGSWDVAADTSDGKLPPEPMAIYHLHQDGSCLIEITVPDGTHRQNGNWRLNSDGTFTLVTKSTAPGLEHGVVNQDRYFLLGLSDGRRVLWNGDGSLILLLSSRRKDGR